MNPSTTRPKHGVFFFVLSLITATSHLGSDIHTSSLPAMAKTFGISINSTQLTLALYMLVLTLSQLFWGVVAQKKHMLFALRWGLVLFGLGGVLCAITQNFTLLLCARMLQGFGGGAPLALWRALLRNRFTGIELARAGSFLSFTVIVILSAGPFLGGVFQHTLSWHFSFLFLAFWAAGIFWLLNYLSHPHSPSQGNLQWKDGLTNLFSNVPFMVGCFCNLLSYAGLFSWITSGSALLVASGKMSPLAFGSCAAFTGLASFIGVFLNILFVKRRGVRFMLYTGWCAMAVTGLALVLIEQTTLASVATLIGAAFFFCAGAMLAFANLYATLFSAITKNMELASSLYAFIQAAGGAAVSLLLSFIHETPSILGLIFILSGLLPLALFHMASQNKQ